MGHFTPNSLDPTFLGGPDQAHNKQEINSRKQECSNRSCEKYYEILGCKISSFGWWSFSLNGDITHLVYFNQLYIPKVIYDFSPFFQQLRNADFS